MARAVIPLPPTLVPRGLSRDEAAAYLGIGPTLFDDLVKEGRMPPARRLKGAVRWDRLALDQAFEKMPTNGKDDVSKGPDDPWGDIRV
jgi:predicted DNA-binding transcriptional regulator AlpA